MRESVRMIVVLTLIAMISAGVLSSVYNFTNEIIQTNLASELESSIFLVLPQAVSVRTIHPGVSTLVEDDRSTLQETEGTVSIPVFEALDQAGMPIGYAFVSEHTGYNGTIKVLVGVETATETITAVKVLEHLETPGLGSRIESASFLHQFVGKSATDPLTLNRDIDNISGATVSAQAVVDAVRNGFPLAIKRYKEER